MIEASDKERLYHLQAFHDLIINYCVLSCEWAGIEGRDVIEQAAMLINNIGILEKHQFTNQLAILKHACTKEKPTVSTLAVPQSEDILMPYIMLRDLCSLSTTKGTFFTKTKTELEFLAEIYTFYRLHCTTAKPDNPSPPSTDPPQQPDQ